MKAKITLIIAEGFFDQVDQIVKESELIGFNCKTQIDEIGLVMGELDAEKIDELRNIEGIMSVELDKEIQLPPHDSEVQ